MAGHIRKHTERILVTSALPYVNNLPHMGTIIGCVLSADVFARYHRSQGNKVLYVCGTDEHGTATETKALEEGLTPREVCDKYYKHHKDVYDWFGIQFDIFGRTSEENHHKMVQDIFKDLHERGLIEEKTVSQTYCPKEEKFLADRFVEGTCPHCGYENARGDQCENCGKLLDPHELKAPRCKTCGATPSRKESNHLFLRLDELQPKLAEWVEEQAENGRWTQNAITTTKAWLERGLEPRTITRDLSWGIPVPLEGYEHKVFYVWFDAPIGYISITEQLLGEQWKEWWMHPSGTLLYQFMAKDNIPFHTILFPATLIGTGKQWTLLHHINVTEYLQHEEGKFSKSRGTGLFGDGAMASGLPPDIYRYYLLRNRPESADTVFAWKDLQEKVNNELIANFGNLVNRTLQFIKRFQEGVVHEAVLDEKATNFYEWVLEEAAMVTDDLEWAKEKDALQRILAISQKGNQYFQEQQPWRTRTENPENCKMSMFILANLVKDLAILAEPFLPATAKRIVAQLGLEHVKWEHIGDLSLLAERRIGDPEPLFQPLDDQLLSEVKANIKGTKEGDASKPLQIKAGRIVEVFRHPDADKLFCEQVDFGDGEIRNIVSGLVGHYREDDLRGKTALFVTNLQPAMLRGKESQGMILAAESGETVEVLFVDAPAGTLVWGENDLEEITITEFSKHVLDVKDKQVHIDGKILFLDGTPITTSLIEEGKVR